MNGATFSILQGRLAPGSLKGWLVGWAVSEVLSFAIALKTLGLGFTFLLMLATSVIGVAVLRRVGLGAAQHLRQTVGARSAPNQAFVDGSLTALGALLLILPGFVSDLVGLALATPSIRQRLMARFIGRGTPVRAARSRPAQPDVIDLAPEDWRVVERPTRH